jgi:hypothetical protein
VAVADSAAVKSGDAVGDTIVQHALHTRWNYSVLLQKHRHDLVCTSEKP